MLAAVLASTLAFTVSPPPPQHHADPSLTTYVRYTKTIEVGPYQTVMDQLEVEPPPVDGAIVGMDARLVDGEGDVVPQSVVMLHHLVFTNGGSGDARRDPQCPRKETRERFWGTSEELRALTLPPGYGYPTDAKDHWRASVMVMHHRAGRRRLRLQYRVTVDPRPVTPVRPYWLSVVPCSPDPQWTVPGSGTATSFRSRTFKLQSAGRIVAVGAHLHGGAKAVTLRQPRCRDRVLVQSLPAYAPASDPLYAVRPLLHEPDPKNISWWQSATGWAVRKDEPLTVTAAYEGTRPHTRVMAIDHVYVAPPDPNVGACSPPRDAQVLGADFAHARLEPPTVNLTLARLGKDGRARPTTTAEGPSRRVKGDAATVDVRDFSFGPARLTVPRGATIRWRFGDTERHDVTLVSGPLGFASPWSVRGERYTRRFDEPGTYLLQCSLHAAVMSQVVTVTRERPRRRDEDRPRR